MRTGAAVPGAGRAVAELAPLVVPPGPQLVARVRAGVVPEQQAVHVADGEVVPRSGPGAVGVLYRRRRERDAQVAPVPEGAVLPQGHGAQAVAVGDALPRRLAAHLDRDPARHEVALAEAAEGVAAPGPERAVAPDRIGLPVGRRGRACRRRGERRQQEQRGERERQDGDERDPGRYGADIRLPLGRGIRELTLHRREAETCLLKSVATGDDAECARAGCGNTSDMRIRATDEVAAAVRERGGRLYVWTSAHRCCTGPLVLLETGGRAAGGRGAGVPRPRRRRLPGALRPGQAAPAGRARARAPRAAPQGRRVLGRPGLGGVRPAAPPRLAWPRAAWRRCDPARTTRGDLCRGASHARTYAPVYRCTPGRTSRLCDTVSHT